jgi:hypothetical protein
MNWDERLLSPGSNTSVLAAVDELFAAQLAAWPQLEKGVENLRRGRSRKLSIRWFDLWVRHIPHRIGSTTARVDPVSVRARPCFLCEGNLPEEQRGIEFADGLVVLANPYPILDHHLTIVSKAHVPQRIVGKYSAMLDLARALPGYMILYNGPECGASAPDHFHFQACRHEGVPIVTDLEHRQRGQIPDYARRVLVFSGKDRSWLEHRFQLLMRLLGKLSPERPEPMVNVVVFHSDSSWHIIVFPRGRHRPQAFLTGDLMLSPASIDLCGVPVLPVESDFENVEATDIERVFEEVSLAEESFDEIVRSMQVAR